MNKLEDLELIGLCVVGIVAVFAIYVLISLIVDYREEAKKSTELVAELSGVGSNACHFTDIGRTSVYDDCGESNTKLYEGFQFVIVKSVIHTETREEIEY